MGRIEELDTGDSTVSCPFLGGPFFLQLDTQNTTLMHNLEKYAGDKNCQLSRHMFDVSTFQCNHFGNDLAVDLG